MKQHTGVARVGEAETGAGAIEMVRALKPDVVIMDLNLPDVSGIDVTRQIVAEFPG